MEIKETQDHLKLKLPSESPQTFDELLDEIETILEDKQPTWSTNVHTSSTPMPQTVVQPDIKTKDTKNHLFHFPSNFNLIDSLQRWLILPGHLELIFIIGSIIVISLLFAFIVIYFTHLRSI